MRLGVVADDITGAGDIAGMTAKAGFRSVVRPFPPGLPGPEDVCVLDTDTRLAAPEVAYERVFEATRSLQAAGCAQFFNKTCSVFRGNIGAEFDAMLGALGEDFAVVVLGFPKNGRVTREGIHYVHGTRLEDSPFRFDPVHPMTRSNLVEILGAQTMRKVGHLSAHVVAQGAIPLCQAIARARETVNYLILDVTSQDDLVTIAEAVVDCRVLCGSSALAEELPRFWPAPIFQPAASIPPTRGLGVLGLAGSLTPQTRLQLEHLRAVGVTCLRLELRTLFQPEASTVELEALAERVSACLKRDEDVLVHTPSEQEAVAALQQEGARRGFSSAEVGQQVSAALAAVALQCRQKTGFNRLLVAGGDTSATVCRQLGIERLQVLEELSPGLPAVLAFPKAGETLLSVLKSGSFGAPEFLAEALRYLGRSR